ncbi:MAG: redox-sensing transcriptional repressor Rex [Ruminococcaceae bacterium]|nr:redox-sensing transcriptional repressor Rex [Oscillospiraceae bacterium]
MKENHISASVIKRLPRYYRFLGELKKQEITRISSGELASLMNLNASQIRQDLNCFGGFGQQGYGYNVEMLYNGIGEILGLNTPTRAIMLGVGKLGIVVAENMNFKKQGFELVGAFDVDPNVLGKTVAGLKVRSVDELEAFCKEYKPTAAFMCVPSSAAPDLSEKLIELGVTGFWNFSHYDIGIKHPEVSVENVHFGDTLMRLSYKIKSKNK